MKSFSGNVKSELASDTQKSKIKTCCAFSLIYGIMSFSRLKDGRFFLKTTNAEIKKLLSGTCAFLSSKKKFFYKILIILWSLEENVQKFIIVMDFSVCLEYTTGFIVKKIIWKE